MRKHNNMAVNLVQTVGPIIAASATIGGIVFQMGKQSEKLDFVGLKVEAQEKKEEYSNQKIAELCSKVDILQTDISYMKEDIHDIKVNISK